MMMFRIATAQANAPAVTSWPLCIGRRRSRRTSHGCVGARAWRAAGLSYAVRIIASRYGKRLRSGAAQAGDTRSRSDRPDLGSAPRKAERLSGEAVSPASWHTVSYDFQLIARRSLRDAEAGCAQAFGACGSTARARRWGEGPVLAAAGVAAADSAHADRRPVQVGARGRAVIERRWIAVAERRTAPRRQAAHRLLWLSTTSVAARKAASASSAVVSRTTASSATRRGAAARSASRASRRRMSARTSS